VYAYFEILYELFERVYQIKKNSWISEDEWSQWAMWIDDIAANPILADIYSDSKGMYSLEFEMFIKSKIDGAKP